MTKQSLAFLISGHFQLRSICLEKFPILNIFFISTSEQHFVHTCKWNELTDLLLLEIDRGRLNILIFPTCQGMTTSENEHKKQQQLQTRMKFTKNKSLNLKIIINKLLYKCCNELENHHKTKIGTKIETKNSHKNRFNLLTYHE